jgi:hypothetical protein
MLNSYLPVQNPISFKQALDIRINDFYTSENKSIFLNEVFKLVSEDADRAKTYGNNSSSQAEIDISFATTLFFIQQFINELPTIVKPTVSNEQTKLRDSVFISYSHQDLSYINDFKRHFKELERTHGLELWDDSKIPVGEKWKDEISAAMARAKVAIFVVSADFFGSDFIANEELPELLRKAEEEGATVISVIVKPCDFSSSILSQYQALNSPSKSVLSLTELEKEELWVSLVHQVKRILNIGSKSN